MSQQLTHVGMDMTPEAMEALSEVTRRLNLTGKGNRAEAIRKMLGTVRYLLQEKQDKAAKIILRYPDGNEVEVTKL